MFRVFLSNIGLKFVGYVYRRDPAPGRILSNSHGDQNKRNDLVRELEKCAKNKLSPRWYVLVIEY
jgi:hypothetical protein